MKICFKYLETAGLVQKCRCIISKLYHDRGARCVECYVSPCEKLVIRLAASLANYNTKAWGLPANKSTVSLEYHGDECQNLLYNLRYNTSIVFLSTTKEANFNDGGDFNELIVREINQFFNLQQIYGTKVFLILINFYWWTNTLNYTWKKKLEYIGGSINGGFSDIFIQYFPPLVYNTIVVSSKTCTYFEGDTGTRLPHPSNRALI